MKCLRAGFLSLLLTGLLLVPGSVRGQLSPIYPIVDGVYHDPVTGVTTAYFGYVNTDTSIRSVSRGINNYFSPEPGLRNGQPTIFLPGTHHHVFATTMTNFLTWSLLGMQATATWDGVYDAPITYQGRLLSDGEPVNGLTDFRFALYDSPDGTNQVPGSTRLFENGATAEQGGPPILVSNGLFTVTINFQSVQLAAGPVWLEIQTRNPAGEGSYQPLTPRQALTTAPHAANAEKLGGRRPDNFLELDATATNTTVTIKSFTGTLSGAFTGNGSGLTNLNGANFTHLPVTNLTGTIAQSNLGETNSYTPVIGNGSANFTTTTQSGYYSKVGNLVYFEIWMIWNGKGAATTGNLVISLPVPPVSPRSVFNVGYVHGITNVTQMVAIANSGQTSLSLLNLSNSGAAPMPVSVGNCGSSGEVQITGTYRWQ